MGFTDTLIARARAVLDDLAGPAPGNERPPSGYRQPSGPQQYPLDVWAYTTLNGSGNGVASIGPQIVREHWQPGMVSVAVVNPSSVVKDAQAVLYLTTSPTLLNPAFQLAQTATGSSGDTASLGGLDLKPGYLLVVQWSGGDANVQVAMHVTGTYSSGLAL